MKKFQYTLLFIFFFILYALIDRNCFTDNSGYTKILFDFLNHGSFPSPPLYFALLYIFGEFFCWGLAVATHLPGADLGISALRTTGYSMAVYFLWSCFAVIKFYFAEMLFKHIVDRQEIVALGEQRISILVLLLFFAHPLSLFFKHMYLGFAAVNVWHNSSTIMMVPFAIWLFALTRNWFTKADTAITAALPLVFVAIFNILIKPSYCLVYVIVFPVFSLITYRFSAKFYQSLLITACITLAIFIQYILLYYCTTDFESSGYTGTNSKVIISPFTVWFFYSGYLIPIKLLLSIMFPLCVLWTLGHRITRDPGYQFAWLGFFVALLIFICVAESGPRLYHANFSWQLIPANFILFLYSLALFYKNKTASISRFKYRLTQAVFYAHVFCGVFYVYRMISLHQYL